MSAEWDPHTDDEPPEDYRRFTGMQRSPIICVLIGHRWEKRWQRSANTWWRDCTHKGCEVAQTAIAV